MPEAAPPQPATIDLHPEPELPAQASLRMAGELSARFRAGMRPLALGTALCVAFSAPLADFLLERHDLERRADAQAADLAKRLAQLPGGPRAELLPAAVAAVMERSGAVEVARVEVLDATGAALAGWRGIDAWPVVSGSAALVVAGRHVGDVRVAVGEAEWVDRDLLLLGIFGVLGLALGLASYFFPLRLFREEDLVRLFGWRSIKATEEERLRLSRDLHDGLGQTLGAAAVALARLGEGKEIGEAAEAARLIDGALDELRRVARGLRPPSLDDLGLGAAVESLAREAERTGLTTDLRIDELPRLDPDVEQTCFRLAQEALTNVVRHAVASRVSVSLGLGAGGLVLEVKDDGRGFSPAGGIGLGLVGARERAARLRGSVRVTSEQGRGTTLRAVIPLAGSAA
ncbi:MAG TPA: sensor histidine kinase [Myxococcales bacterium]|nr:sensor histidine kinase [Myxococcales bacterium]